ncbi:hemerythrin domain-containing protein [Gaoshiqia sediminis]|uniref:Hemerythrin domain-containing protein n=1 Tax=Gaoshiqia sediminis TaxID=2986998 RepID=A0AA42C8H3_9BACT|nr:hemerythrin domain-containing protein [Gaoshiqia sediminis]MCW0484714.1 hemerythrin domain-containing protein [Gaoshiqia sediminis]
MHTATQNLENDHVHILRLTYIMEAMAEKGSTNADHFDEVVSLIRNFADGLHHAKEEDLLFPMMGEKGFSPEQGPVAVMLHEHIQGRNYVSGMIEGIAQFRAGNTEAVNNIYANMQGYAILLQNHISKENNILFRMADQVISPAEQQMLLDQFAEVENKAIPGYNAENSIAKIDLLASEYLQ